jgi:hypothetical protein
MARRRPARTVRGPVVITVKDMDGTIHAALPSFHPGRTLCGYPPRRKDGRLWPMSSPAHSVEYRGRWSDVTCEWCRADLGPVRG